VCRTHLSMLVASLTRPADPSSYGVFFQLGSHPALSLMRAPLALIFRAFDADLPAVATLVFMCPTLLAHMLPFAFFNHFFAPSPEILHLAFSSLVCAPPTASDVDLCP